MSPSASYDILMAYRPVKPMGHGAPSQPNIDQFNTHINMYIKTVLTPVKPYKLRNIKHT
jgi:hypothetical protein